MISRFARIAWCAVIVAACVHVPPRPEGAVEFWGFTGPWDQRSDVSASQNAGRLSRVITGWIALDTISFQPVQLYPDNIGSQPMLTGRAMALITSYSGSRFHPEIIRGLGGSEQTSASSAGAIAKLLDSTTYRGVVIDLEGMTPRDLDQLLTFTHHLSD